MQWLDVAVATWSPHPAMWYAALGNMLQCGHPASLQLAQPVTPSLDAQCCLHVSAVVPAQRSYLWVHGAEGASREGLAPNVVNRHQANTAPAQRNNTAKGSPRLRSSQPRSWLLSRHRPRLSTTFAVRSVLAVPLCNHVATSAGMNFLAGMLLLYLTEESAFWTLADIVEKYLVDYFLESMLGVVVDQLVCGDLLQQYFPMVTEHAEELQVDLVLVATQWYGNMLTCGHMCQRVVTSFCCAILLTASTQRLSSFRPLEQQWWWIAKVCFFFREKGLQRALDSWCRSWACEKIRSHLYAGC